MKSKWEFSSDERLALNQSSPGHHMMNIIGLFDVGWEWTTQLKSEN
jgi:hypothetical protein